MRTRPISVKFNHLKKVFIIVFLGVATLATLKLLPAPDINVNTSITFYDIEGEAFLQESLPMRQQWISLEETSPHVINGFIATEDRHFYNHFGFDIPGIMRSVFVNLSTGSRIQGASTITQQYARNLFLSFERTWQRKIKEAFYAIRLELNYDKDTILEGYINTINFGHGNYGIEDAAHFYFGKSSRDLTLAEASILIGIPKGPSIYSPLMDFERSSSRQNLVLDSMLRENFITSDEHAEALQTQLVITGETPKSEDDAPYFIEAVLQELDEILDEKQMNDGHLHIHTTLDRQIQTHINEAIEQTILGDEVQTAVIVLEPETGHVLGLSGGTDFRSSQYNRALYSQRQVGSLMKPFLYYAALEFGFNPSTSFISRETNFVYNNGAATYSPNNFSNQYPSESNNNISMANALAVSDNIYAVKTHTFLGMSVLPNIVSRLGITAEIPEIPSAALGVSSINIMEMAEAYAVFANNGHSVNHRFITQIENHQGTLIYESPAAKNELILDSTQTYIFNEMMTGMFELRHNHHLAATGLSIIPNLTNRYAGKSGSTDTDSWMIGYTPDLVTTVWTGYDEGRFLSGVEINRYAQTIWCHVMENSLGSEATWFEAPDHVIPVSIDPLSGYLATENSRKITLFFEETNLPKANTPQLEDSEKDF